MRINKYGLLLLSFILLFAYSYAQQVDSILAVYKDNFQQEKLHLHFDKNIYQKGETIWFKAYIFAGDTPSDYSRNFFVDWFDQDGKLLKHTVNPIFESSARGQFDIPKNYNGKNIYVKAYTKWMLNFDTAFIYTKTIQLVINDSSIIKPIKQSVVSLQFFPEGGELVAGLITNIGFIATNKVGEPVSIKGAIVNKKNELVDSIITTHDGMGFFTLEPNMNEEYQCNWIDEFGIEHATRLPKINKNGIVLNANIQMGKIIYVIKRTQEVPNNLKLLHCVGTMNQQVVYNSAINLSNKKQVGAEINIDQSKTGILQLTVFDENWIPIAERVLFANNNQYQFFPEIGIENKRFTKRSKNSISIHVPDSISSNMSISITDAVLSNDTSSNIFSQLLLSGDIKGYVHNPAYYFSSDKQPIPQHLDLVMLTHGWRKYKWEDIISNKMPEIKFPLDSDYLQIKGKVVFENKGLFKSNQQLTLIMQSKDSSKQYFLVPLQTDGSFNQRGLIFYDTAKVFYQLNQNKKNYINFSANFQSGFPIVDYATNFKPYFFSKPDTININAGNSFYNIARKMLQNFDTTVTLKEVTVYSKSKSEIEVLDEKYTTGLFSNKNDYSFDVIKDERAQAAINVFYYLQNLIPGMTMSLPILGANGAEDANSNNAPGLNWRDGSPDIFINEMPSDAVAAMSIQMSDVAYIKVFKPPFMGSTGSGASGAIVIYTKKASDKSTDGIKGLNSAILTGYTSYKEFYQPDYTYPQNKKLDTRSTLYWNPYLLTDKKNKTIKIDFFNNDITKKFRVVLEGVNAKGKLTRVEKIIE
ncbi:MAG: hypothetical protein Q8K64_11940 [Sediminibacterium sp.]|nr:hypothetical protein [Sediminibacterium sp.]